MSKIHSHIPKMSAGQELKHDDPSAVTALGLMANGKLRFTVLSESSEDEENDIIVLRRTYAD